MGIKKRFRLSAPKMSYARVLGEVDVTMFYSAIAGGPPNVIPATTASPQAQLSTLVRRRYLRPITNTDHRQKMQLWLADSIERAKHRLLEARVRLIPSTIPVAQELETTMHLANDTMQDNESMRIAA
jgi:hypothetical protein